MHTPLTILTGASRGMGLAMARQLLQPGHTLLCISRRANPELAAAARAAEVPLAQWTLDLLDPAPAADRLQDWLQGLDPKSFTAARLINNAAMLPRIGPVSALGHEDFAHALRVGLEAPLALSAAFLRATEAWGLPRRVLHISSGLGRRAMASQAAYCAVKAGLDHASRCMALEEALKPQGARVCALAPGVIDTDMQGQLRSADPAHFPDQGGFAQLQAQGLLWSPEEAARRVLAYLEREDFGLQAVADVREA